MHCVYSSDDTKVYVDNDFSVVVVVRWSEHEEMRMRLNSLDNFARNRKEAHEINDNPSSKNFTSSASTTTQQS